MIWVLISEIFPTSYRAEGQALGSFTHWIFAALLTTFFPKMVTAFAPGCVFLFFCGDDGAAAALGEADGARDERRAARGDAEETRARCRLTRRPAYSAPPGRVDSGDVDLLHLHHRLEGTLCLTATSRKRLG